MRKNKNTIHKKPLNSPKVSVVIPTYNRPHLIRRAIQSVLNQTYQNFEIIVVDDSPNDETEKVVKSFNDKRIKYIHNKKKSNLPKARNQGVRESDPNSKYIAFLDDDDEWLPQFLEKTVEKLESHPELIGVCPDHLVVHEDGTVLKKTRAIREKWNSLIGNGAVLRKLLFIKQNIWFDERLLRSEDLDFGIRVLKENKIGIIEKPLQIYHYSTSINQRLASTSIPTQTIDYFFQKHINYYSKFGRKALSFFYFYIGKCYSRSGEIKKGKQYFLKAFRYSPKLIHLIYYLFWSFPKFARNFTLDSLLYKIAKAKKKIKNILSL